MKNFTGLLTRDNYTVPLTGVRITGDLAGRGAKITVQQKYRNTEKKPIEAVYKFPLPEGSAIAGFRIWIGERLVEGVVEERDKAFDKYDDALTRGDGAYLMDEERPNIFTMSVGNLNPGMEATIEIDLVMLLDAEGFKQRLTLPTTISPRYVPADMPDEDGIPVEEIVHPVYAPSVPYGLSMSLIIHHNGKLAAVESPSHPVRISLEDNLTRVELTNETTQMDRDFVLIIDPGEQATGRAYYCAGDRHSYMQLDLVVPETETGESADPGEVIFLLDCSGSMHGQSMSEAKKAVEICLKALPAGSRFNVYRFGSEFDSFFRESLVYSEANLAKALKQLEKTDADLGGTEMYAPFKDIYRAAPGTGGRSIILLTDGEVGNEKKLAELVSSHRANTRVYAIGIGSGPNEYLIKELARAGNGAAEFVYPGERIEPKVLRIFSRISGPRLDNIRVMWADEDAEQAPEQPAVFTGQATTIFARSRSADTKQTKITVHGTMDDKPVEWIYDIQKVTPDHMPLPQLWARERIRDLEGASGQNGSRQQRRKETRFSDQIIDISKTYGILSTLTSYLGIEKRIAKDKTSEAAELRKVPTLVTNGWHGGANLYAKAPKKRRSFSMDYAAPADGAICDSMFEQETSSSDKRVLYKLIDLQPDQTDVLMQILSAQQTGGGFLLDRKLARSLGANWHELKKIAKVMNTDGKADALLLLSTAIIFEILQTRFAHETNTWRALTAKSRTWLDNVVMQEKLLIDGQDISVWVKEYVADQIKEEIY